MSDMSDKSFAYVTYIASTPEKVWAALFDAEMTKQYWGVAKNVSTWKKGATWQHVDYDDDTKVKVRGEILEIEAPKKLVFTWASNVPGAQTTQVTFTVEPFMGTTKLTLLHEHLDEIAAKTTADGWPAILSSLKSLLETGKPLAPTTQRWGGR
jgi:uncharacterized protein YndB with AHSA1/START domain